MNLIKVIIFTGILLLISSLGHTHEPEKGKPHVSIGPAYLEPDTHLGFGRYSDEYSKGFSVTANGDADSNGSIEVTLLYINQYFYRQDQGSEIVDRANRFYVFMGYRHWFIPQISAAMSFFSTYSMGKAHRVHENQLPGVNLDSSAQKSSSTGISFSVIFEATFSDEWMANLDIRHLHDFNMTKGEIETYQGFIVNLKKRI